MIRRKLTRIEVTLDDTKELDDFFSKNTQTAISAGLSIQTATAKFTSLNTLVTASTLNPQAESLNINTPANNPTEAGLDRLSYNPQPYNQSSRFQFNQETQQLR